MRSHAPARYRLLRVAIAGLAVAVAAAACSSTVNGRGALDAPALKSSSNLTVKGDANSDFDKVAKNALTDVQTFWKQYYPEVSGGQPLPDLKGGIYSVDDKAITAVARQNACLAAQPKAIVDNAFFCTLDDSIAYDRVGFVPDLAKQYGPYFVAMVFAHEYGHALQGRLGVIKNRATILKESQADCAAGAYTAWVLNLKSDYFRPSAADFDKVLVGYIQLRDPAGTAANEAGSHGSGFDRLSALADGLKNGPKYCYATDWDRSRTFTERAFANDADYQAGGDQTLAEVLNPGPPSSGGGGLQPSLNEFWTAQAKQINKSFQSVQIKEAAHPPCLGETDSEFNYCPNDNTVYYSASIAKRAYSFGDYALGTLFVYGWGMAVRHQLFGRSLNDSAALLAAGCYAGAYSKSINQANSGRFELSAPDMDEATVAVLTMVDDELAFKPSGKNQTTGLDRIESFRKGYFGGLGSC